MQKIMLPFLLILSSFVWSQTVTISGNCEGYGVKFGTPALNNIYYSLDGEKFSRANVIKYNQSYDYKFILPLKELKNVQELYFTKDTTVDLNDRYGCFYTIHIGRILESKANESKENINIACDIDFDMNCEVSVHYGAEERELGRFVGEYKLTKGDTLRSIQLGDSFFKYTSRLSQMDSNQMNEESGSWNYNDTKKILTIYGNKRYNTYLGLMLRTKYSYVFKVMEKDGVLSFYSDEYQLTKLTK